ncbi:CaiB/BaiF CoA transferase family protein [Bacillus sp. JJ722]|uniref:CaiB/BaiF CoA transferase family protein n=1 Tax=Bacillus sp. JJ722 TaxID=3122973 RepID=UPI002FFE0D1A
MTIQENPKQPLSHIKVLDLTSNISGPSATAILGDLGAEIIKIERPQKGDDARGMGPFIGGESAYFLAINRNKQSVVVDIRKKEGQEIIHKLASKVDIVIENFRRGVLEKYGLDGQSLCRQNEKLIYCSLSAYGEQGDDALKPGYDAVLQARTGIMSVTGTKIEEPVRAGVSILDMGSGMWSVIAILTALQHRERTGEGQIVGTSLFETGAYWMNYHLTAYESTQVDPLPQGTSHSAFAPYGSYQTKDDLLLLGISNDSIFHRLTKAINREEWNDDPRFIHNENRLFHRKALETLLNECFMSNHCEYWLSRLNDAGVPCSRIQKVSQVLNDPHFKAMEIMTPVSHSSLETISIPRVPIRMEKSKLIVKRGAPLLGEHTYKILKDLALTDEEIREYAYKGIIECIETEGVVNEKQ